MKNGISKFFEYVNEEDFKPIKSFYLKSELNPKIWNSDQKLRSKIRKDLMKIAEDYFENLELKIQMEDIILCGSLSNYNWSEYSDIDIHILLDFEKINKDTKLVKKYMDLNKSIWNIQHDIIIEGFGVEIYVQDVDENHISSGQYSILSDSWLKKPSLENFIPDEELIRIKSEDIMSKIDEIESEVDIKDWEYLNNKIKKIWKKIKDSRKSGLEKDGEFSIENLVFKLLRRNGYISKIIECKRKSYDAQFK